MLPPSISVAEANRKWLNWLFPVILIVAFALRWLFLQWAEANAYGSQGDSMEAYEVAAKYLAGDERAQYLGQPNCNPHAKLPGPLWTLFCVAGLKLGGSLQGVSVLEILANVIAIALTWWLTRQWFGLAAATFAALFMAVSVEGQFHSVIVFNPSLMPLFGAIIFLALHRCFQYERSRTIFWIPFLIVIGPQFHMSPLGLILPLTAAAWLWRLKPNWPWLLAGIAAGMICYWPYVLGDSRHHWANTHGILFGGEGGFFPGALKVFSAPLSFLVNLWAPKWTYTPDDYQALARQTFGGLAGLAAANGVSVIFALVLIVMLWRLTRRAMKGFWTAPRETVARSPQLLLPAFVLATYLFLNLIGGKEFQSRYCLVVLPLLFALAGLAAVKCLESPRLRKFFLPVMVLTVAADLWFWPRMCWFEHNRIANGPVFVPGLKKLESVYQDLKSRADGPVQVQFKPYLDSLPKNDQVRRNARLISLYVRWRELELQPAGRTTLRTNFFDLRAASLVNSNDPAVAFYGNGIALVAVPE
jgi:hypothetical protein